MRKPAPPDPLASPRSAIRALVRCGRPRARRRDRRDLGSGAEGRGAARPAPRDRDRASTRASSPHRPSPRRSKPPPPASPASPLETSRVASASPRPPGPTAHAADSTAEPNAPLVAVPAPSATASSEPWSPSVLRAPGAGSLAQLGLTPEGRARALVVAGGPADKAGPAGKAGERDVAGMGSLLADSDRARGLGAGGRS